MPFVIGKVFGFLCKLYAMSAAEGVCPAFDTAAPERRELLPAANRACRSGGALSCPAALAAVFLAFAALSFVSPALAKYQVCSITINSADEIQTFKKYLSAVDFDFIELLPQNKGHYAKHDSHWFNEVCQKPYKCDILVVSGHFGGTFFGESGFSLPTELMEEHACRGSCRGILSQAKEIFLFGCNTLASKKRDSRSSSEYLQVLLDDGMAKEMAERVVAARYTPLEAPFYRRMNFVFEGSKTIYGFDERGPLGKNVRGPLGKYFQSINEQYGSYKNYLDKKGYERPRNVNLFASLGHTTLGQAHLSVSAEDKKSRSFFQNKCRLYDAGAPFSQRMEALESVFQSGNSGSAFFAVDHFLERQMERILEGEGGEIFRSIRQNKSFSDQFQSFYSSLKDLPYIKIVYLNILKKFQWIKPDDLRERRKRDLIQLIEKPDSEAYVSVLLLTAENQLAPGSFYFSKDDLPEDYIQNIWSLLILERLQAEAPEQQPAILDFCEKNIKQDPPVLCYQALNTLAHIKPTAETGKKAARYLDHQDKGMIYYSLRVIGQSAVRAQEVHRKVSSFLGDGDPWIAKEALDSLGFLRSPYEDIQRAVSGRLLKDGRAASDEKSMGAARDVLWVLGRMNIQSAEAAENIISHNKQFAAYAASGGKKAGKYEKIVLAGIRAFQNTDSPPLFVLDYFYDILESFENLPRAYAAIETIYQMKTRDIGIHYRISQFYHLPKAAARKKVLKRLSRWTWFHPETQRELAMFLFDDNREVRQLAAAVWRNLSNITESAYDLIQSYSESNPEIRSLARYLKGG